MESLGEMELKNLIINELTLGKELTKQLQIHLNVPVSSSEALELLVQRILNSYDKALNLLTGGNGATATEAPAGTSESPRSLSASPTRSEDSDREFHRDQHDHRDTPRRRNAMPRWTKYVQVSPGIGLEGPLDDGYSWRKYGQKDILGAKYPRGYYRCTHRHVQGCLATKQVQRSDDDPTIFEITYRGRHTCSQGAPEVLNPPPPLPERPEPSTGVNHHHQQVTSHSQPQQNQNEVLLSFQTGLRVITDNIDTHNQPVSSLNFPPMPTANAHERHAFFPSEIQNNLPGNISPSFLSPTDSGSNYFSVSSSHIINNFAGNLPSHPSESELTDLISLATSATNSPTIGLHNPYSEMEFDPNFTFENPRYFP